MHQNTLKALYNQSEFFGIFPFSSCQKTIFLRVHFSTPSDDFSPLFMENVISTLFLIKVSSDVKVFCFSDLCAVLQIIVLLLHKLENWSRNGKERRDESNSG